MPLTSHLTETIDASTSPEFLTKTAMVITSPATSLSESTTISSISNSARNKTSKTRVLATQLLSSQTVITTGMKLPTFGGVTEIVDVSKSTIAQLLSVYAVS